MKSCQKSGELREIFYRGRKTGEDSEYRESPGKIRRVGKYGDGPREDSIEFEPVLFVAITNQSCMSWSRKKS